MATTQLAKGAFPDSESKKSMNLQIHTSCRKTKVNLIQHKRKVTDIYSQEDSLAIMEMFLIHDLAIKEEAEEILKNKYHWINSANVIYSQNLFKELLLSANLQNSLCMSRASKIDSLSTALGFFKSKDYYSTLDSIEICPNCLRAVIQRLQGKLSTTVNDDEEVVVTLNEEGESKIDCFFRHIRNSLAHNNIFMFDNDNILLLDKRSGKKGLISALILIHKRTLTDWIEIIKRGPTKSGLVFQYDCNNLLTLFYPNIYDSRTKMIYWYKNALYLEKLNHDDRWVSIQPSEDNPLSIEAGSRRIDVSESISFNIDQLMVEQYLNRLEDGKYRIGFKYKFQNSNNDKPHDDIYSYFEI